MLSWKISFLWCGVNLADELCGNIWFLMYSLLHDRNIILHDRVWYIVIGSSVACLGRLEIVLIKYLIKQLLKCSEIIVFILHEVYDEVRMSMNTCLKWKSVLNRVDCWFCLKPMKWISIGRLEKMRSKNELWQICFCKTLDRKLSPFSIH